MMLSQILITLASNLKWEKNIYNMWVKKTIGEQRKVLANLLEPPMVSIAEVCISVWQSSDKLDQTLSQHFVTIPHCHLLYAVDKYGRQISANITAKSIDSDYRNQDLSLRPYAVNLYPKRHFMLSSVYISQTMGKPCISTVQPVVDKQQFLGFVVADFDVQDLPLFISPPKANSYCEITQDQLTETDVPLPKRPRISLDQYLSDLQGVLETLISAHGVFHCQIHYGSGQVTLWQIKDPFQYRLYSAEQLLNANMYLAYSKQHYSENAIVSTAQVREVLEKFRILRLASDSIYLRTSSLNVINGMVGLSFSCEGSQYMTVESFLIKDLVFWLGQE